MTRTLARLADEPHPSLGDFVRGYEEWKAASPAARERFHEARTAYMLRFAGAYFDGAREMGTSGSSVGIAKKYRWGPCLREAHAFHDHLCFGDLGRPVMLAVFFTLDEGVYRVLPAQLERGGEQQIATVHPAAENAVRLREVAAGLAGGRPIVVRVLPSQADVVRVGGYGFFEAWVGWPHIIHLTGEAASDGLVSHLRGLGLSVRDTMKVWNGGAGFYTCPHGGLHWDDFTARYDWSASPELVTTDLFNLAQPFHRVPTGDRVTVSDAGPCPCGLRRQANVWEDKPCVLRLGGRDYDWYAVRRDFIRAYARESGIGRVDDAWASLLALSVGVSPSAAFVFYAAARPLDRAAVIAVQESLSATWRMKVAMVGGLRHGHFKSLRVFRMRDEEAERLLGEAEDRGRLPMA